jgi:hypothetical protein
MKRKSTICAMQSLLVCETTKIPESNQGARRRRLITLGILSLPVIQVRKPPLAVP